MSSEIFNTELNVIFEKFFEAPEDPPEPEPYLDPLESDVSEPTKATEDSDEFKDPFNPLAEETS